MALLAAARRASFLPILRRASSALLRPMTSPFPATRHSSPSSIDDAKTALMKAALDAMRAEHGSSASAAALDSLRAATDSLSTAAFEDQLLHGIDSAVNPRATASPRHLGHGEVEKKASRPSLTFDVIVSKSNGYKLQFTCVAYPDHVTICSMNMTPGGSQKEQDLLEDMAKYDGFNKLDENLKKSFHNYLELRGITPTTMNLFREYIISNGTRKEHFWLNKLSDFVKKD